MVLAGAENVVIVPGYGMARAQAQHGVKELVELLDARGARVRIAVHHAAGVLPGHMNILLDEAGFADVPIVLSSDLDELVIWQILSQIDSEAPRYGVDAHSLASRLVYGVGTRLITSEGDGALGGVYKLVAVAEDSGFWPDFNADNLFYANKGRLYAYYLLLRELEVDFANVIRERDLGAPWTQMLDTFREAATLQPWVVVNGDPASQFLPSHLAAQGFYLLRARTQLKEIINILLK